MCFMQVSCQYGHVHMTGIMTYDRFSLAEMKGKAVQIDTLTVQKHRAK